MEISSMFREILKSIDYHVDHLSDDFFSNEERLPELLPIFVWFSNNLSPKSNCVTPRELVLYTSTLSKHDYSSLEKISKAMNKLYDKSTKESVVYSSDLETLKEKIFNSQQELNDLKSRRYLYEKKLNMMDDEISLLKQKENVICISCSKTESNLGSVVKHFTEEVAKFGFNINKIHDHITNSMKNDSENLTKLALKTLTNSTDEWCHQIYKIINILFNEKTISSEINDKLLMKILMLSLLFKSVAALRISEMNQTCEIARINYAITNMLNVKNCFDKNQKNLQSNELNIAKYFTNHREVSIDLSQQTPSSEYDDLKSRLYATVIIDAQRKLNKMGKIDNNLTFIQESIEYYIMMCDVLWCLMKTGCLMTNFKCELLLNSINILDKTFNDIKYTQQWIPDNSKINLVESSNLVNDNNAFFLSEIVKFDGSSLNISNSVIVEHLTKMVKLWKSKYHYSSGECNELTVLQQKLQVNSDAVNELFKSYSSKAT